MKKQIVIVAAVHHSGGWEKQTLANNSSYVGDESPWHSGAANQCLAVVRALKSASDTFLVKVLTGAPSGKRTPQHKLSIGIRKLIESCSILDVRE